MLFDPDIGLLLEVSGRGICRMESPAQDKLSLRISHWIPLLRSINDRGLASPWRQWEERKRGMRRFQAGEVISAASPMDGQTETLPAEGRKPDSLPYIIGVLAGRKPYVIRTGFILLYSLLYHS
jgi:hypothetical protein